MNEENIAKKKILIICDLLEPELTESLLNLKIKSSNIIYANSGISAIEKLNKSSAGKDIIFINSELKLISREEFIEFIIKNKLIKNSRLVILTKESEVSTNAYDCISFPYTESDMEALLTKFCSEY